MLNSLTGVKGPSGCAVRQNSKSDLVQGLVVLELMEQPIAPLALGLLYWRRSNCQTAAMMTIQEVLARPGPFEHEQAGADGQTKRTEAVCLRWENGVGEEMREKAEEERKKERGEVEVPRLLTTY